MIFTGTDIEYSAILLSFMTLIIIGCKRRDCVVHGRLIDCLIIDKSTSNVLKGIGCVFVLMGHWGTRTLHIDMPWGVSKVVWMTSANIALFWFMFFSGYGLSLKNYDKKDVFVYWKKRIIKIWGPAFIVCICSVLLGFILCQFYEENIYKILGFPAFYSSLHHLTFENIGILLFQCSGFVQWYVVCIIYFYTIFYISVGISKKFKYNHSVVLCFLMVGYFFVAKYYYGEAEAHYYRYPWVFMLGHLVASYSKNTKAENILCIIAMLLSLFGLSRNDIVFNLMYLMILIAIGYMSQIYTINNILLSGLGGVSYWFFLSHGTIGWPLMIVVTERQSVILWVVFSLISSWLLKELYDKVCLKR